MGIRQTQQNGSRVFLLILLFVALYLTFQILRPFLHTIILAVVLASMFHPLQERLAKAYRGRINLAAFTVALIIIFLIVIPAVALVFALITQGVTSISRITDWLTEGNLQILLESPNVATRLAWVQERFGVLGISPERLQIQQNLLQVTQSVGQFLLSRGAGLVGSVANVFFHFFVMIFISFYLVRDGKEMIVHIKYLSPLREDQEDRILSRIRQVVRSVLLGTLMTALVQGLVGGIGLAIVGIPALFWGAVMGFSSLIPIVGTALIWVPAVLYLLLIGSVKSGIFLAIWSILVVGSIDNFLRPFFMKGKGALSPFYIFLAIIGGIQIFGLIGILYGPLILGFAMVVLYIYSVEYRDLLEAYHPQIISPREDTGEPSE